MIAVCFLWRTKNSFYPSATKIFDRNVVGELKCAGAWSIASKPGGQNDSEFLPISLSFDYRTCKQTVVYKKLAMFECVIRYAPISCVRIMNSHLML